MRILTLLLILGLSVTSYAEESVNANTVETSPVKAKFNLTSAIKSESEHLVGIKPKLIDKNIEFKEGNFFAITETFTEDLLNDFAEKIYSHKGKELIIYFDSPGGSVWSLARMVGITKSSNVKLICVSRFAASAAFTLFQFCDERYVLPEGIIMSHNWAGSFYDEGPRIQSLFNVINQLVMDIEVEITNKLKLDFKEYKRLINNNLWMNASIATKYNAIDGVVNKVSCDQDLIEDRVLKTRTFYSFFGRHTQEYYVSGCPLLTKEYPVKKKKRRRRYYEDEE